MARTSQNPRLINRSSRIKLKARRDPYWHLIAEGQHIGYRRTATGGTWIARLYSPERGRRFQSVGVADGSTAADGVAVLSFQEAVGEAQRWFRQLTHNDAGEVVSGPYTVRDLMTQYLADRQREKRRKLRYMQSIIDAHILPKLGNIELSKLTHSKVKAWRDSLAENAPMVRVKTGETPATRTIDTDDPDVMRKRHATANRIFTTLRAALNYAYKRNRVATKAAWEKISPFRSVDAPKVRYLTIAECERLIASCPADFQRLVRAVLYSGCRYGELIGMAVNAFDKAARTLHIAESKSGKARFIALTDEGTAFFASITDGKDSDSLMFTHDEGRQAGEGWLDSQQRYWMQEACIQAQISPAISFHILRHTYASQLAMHNTPMPVIAAQLGHADTRMTERHYAHLGFSYVADVVRANLPSFGFSSDNQQASHTA